MQGRALKQTSNFIQSFPKEWQKEFPIIKKLGFKGIEWIYDKRSEKSNPILTSDGRKDMLKISTKYGVDLENIVLDWFMMHPLLVNEEVAIAKKIEWLRSLIYLSAKTGFKRIILPLLEANGLDSENKKEKLVRIFQKNLSNEIDSSQIEIDLETSLSPIEELKLIKKIDSENVKICFDMGNNASLGYSAPRTINTIKKVLGAVHIKDREVNGPTVPLGKGAVNFLVVFQTLHDINFKGPFTLQAFRDQSSDNLQLLTNYLIFIKKIIKQVNQA